VVKRGGSWLVLIVVACTRAPSSPESHAGTNALEPPRLDAPTGKSEKPEPASNVKPPLPKRTPIPRSTLERVDEPAFTKMDIAKPKRLGWGGVLLPGIPGPDRVVIENRAKRGMLVDAETGHTIVEFPTPRDVSATAGAIVLETTEPELVRLSDNRQLKPKLEGVDASIKTRWLVGRGEHDPLVLLLEARDGRKLVGLPEDARMDTFRAQALPFAADDKKGLSAIASDDTSWHFVTPDRKMPMSSGGTPWFLPHREGCVRAQLGPDAKLRCIEHEPNVSFSGPRWMSDGWLATQDYFAHPTWGTKVAKFADIVGTEPCSTPLTLANPPRAFVMCRDASALVGPDAVLGLDGLPQVRISGLLGADPGPIVPLLASSDDPTDLWLDLAGKHVWRTPSLKPIAVAAFAGVGMRALAQVPGTKEVLLLDFVDRRMQLVAKLDDCPGELIELRDGAMARSPTLLILSCVTPSPPNRVTHGHIWSEIVNVKTRTRHRTRLLPEVYFEDGVVVLSTRKRMSAESRAAPGEISSAVVR
jgi:hypothetical protein